MKARNNLLAGVLLNLLSMSTHAAIDAIQTIDINNKNVYLQNALKAGDTLTIRVKGLIKATVTKTNFTTGTDKALRKLKVKLDDNYFVESPGESYEFCPAPNVTSQITCVQRKFVVIRNGGTYTTLNIMDISNGNSINTVVMVEKTSGWSLQASGGFLISGLTNPKYFIEEETDSGAAMQRVARNKNAEDDISLGLAGYMHTCNEAWRLAGWNALMFRCFTFGLGLSDQSDDLSFFPGISWRFGEELYLTVGMHLAKTDTLPNGLRVGSEVDSPNAISTLDDKYTAKPFISVSYQFLGGSTRNSFTNKFTPSDGN